MSTETISTFRQHIRSRTRTSSTTQRSSKKTTEFISQHVQLSTSSTSTRPPIVRNITRSTAFISRYMLYTTISFRTSPTTVGNIMSATMNISKYMLFTPSFMTSSPLVRNIKSAQHAITLGMVNEPLQEIVRIIIRTLIATSMLIAVRSFGASTKNMRSPLWILVSSRTI
ncbi:unnamed protein product [Prorocentrum cordatum]|uniref:Uncharacterized protein n=1 Tax=Prorocentrum cordatum TaxID=2364126 RepID=A0ABN9RME5_9DINO|nr:unnamed protein product [Polarella glacialis]